MECAAFLCPPSPSQITPARCVMFAWPVTIPLSPQPHPELYDSQTPEGDLILYLESNIIFRYLIMTRITSLTCRIGSSLTLWGNSRVSAVTSGDCHRAVISFILQVGEPFLPSVFRTSYVWVTFISALLSPPAKSLSRERLQKIAILSFSLQTWRFANVRAGVHNTESYFLEPKLN